MENILLILVIILLIAHFKFHLSLATIKADLAALVAKVEAEFNKKP